MPPKKAEKGLNKTQLYGHISSSTDLNRSQVTSVFECLHDLLKTELKANRSLTIPNIVKIVPVYKAAKPERVGRNPATGEAITVKAKPARKMVKVKPVKALKELL